MIRAFGVQFFVLAHSTFAAIRKLPLTEFRAPINSMGPLQVVEPLARPPAISDFVEGPPPLRLPLRRPLPRQQRAPGAACMLLKSRTATGVVRLRANLFAYS